MTRGPAGFTALLPPYNSIEYVGREEQRAPQGDFLRGGTSLPRAAPFGLRDPAVKIGTGTSKTQQEEHMFTRLNTLSLAALSCTAPVIAADYPSRPVRVIVGFGAG